MLFPLHLCCLLLFITLPHHRSRSGWYKITWLALFPLYSGQVQQYDYLSFGLLLGLWFWFLKVPHPSIIPGEIGGHKSSSYSQILHVAVCILECIFTGHSVSMCSGDSSLLQVMHLHLLTCLFLWCALCLHLFHCTCMPLVCVNRVGKCSGGKGIILDSLVGVIDVIFKTLHTLMTFLHIASYSLR